MVIVSCTNMKKWREQGMRKAAVWIGMVMVLLLSACSAEPAAKAFSGQLLVQRHRSGNGNQRRRGGRVYRSAEQSERS